MRPAIYMDFARGGRLDPLARVTRASGGTRRDASGVWREVPPMAARLHHAFDAGALGLLIETARTNAVVNPRGEGLVAGTPGTLPTGWVQPATQGGIERTLSAVSARGVGGLGLRLQGTATNTGQMTYEPAMRSLAPAASPAQSRVVSAVLWIAGGGVANITNISLGGIGLTSGGAVVAGNTFSGANLAGQLSAAPRQFSSLVTLTADPSIARFNLRLLVQTTVGQTSDLTLGVAWLLDEPSALYASTPILPPGGSPSASIRATETLEVWLADWGASVPGGEGTLLVAGRAAGGLEIGGGGQRAVQMDDGTDANVIRMDRGPGRTMRGEVIVGGVSQGLVSSAGLVADQAGMVSLLGYDSASMALTLDGAPVVEGAVSGAFSPSRMLLGGWGGTIERVAWWPRRIPNASMQSLARQGALT